MNKFSVIHRDNGAHFFETPEVFLCEADDYQHAEEQAANSYPNSDILWIFEGPDHRAALLNYYDSL